MGNPRFKLQPSTVTPPALTADEEDPAAEYPPWVLLESQAYVAKRENGTTAFSKTWDSKEIQVTICPRRPPCVSYVCVYSDSEISMEPKILAMDEDLILLRITVSCQRDVMENVDYYVYRAADRVAGGKPSLRLLKRPPAPYICFNAEQIGIMHCGNSHNPPKHGSESRYYLRRHVPIAEFSYIIAVLKVAPWEMQTEFPQEKFILCLYHSKEDAWTVTVVSLNEEQRKHYGSNFEHANHKVITIGGDVGTIAFVDLYRGILFCDLTPAKGEPIPSLRYIELPYHSIVPNSMFKGDARLVRDIAVINNEFKFVELHVRWKESKIYEGELFEDGWIAITWSRPISFTGSWRKEYKVDTRYMNLDNNPCLKDLPRVLNDEDMILPPFKRINICQPTLGLHEDGSCIVYLMVKKSRRDRDAWVLAVDMKMNTLAGITSFAATRNNFITFAYAHSKISKYLPKSDMGPHGHLKRPRESLRSSRKISEMEGAYLVAEGWGV